MFRTIKPLLFLLLLALSSFANAKGTGDDCGMIEGTKYVDGLSFEICDKNKTMMINDALSGAISNAGLPNGEGGISPYESRRATYNEAQKSFIDESLKTKELSSAHLLGNGALVLFVSLIIIFVKSLTDLTSDNFLGRYKAHYIVGSPLLAIVLFAPIPYKDTVTSPYGYLIKMSSNVGNVGGQLITNVFVAFAQRLGLTTNIGQDIDPTKNVNDKTQKIVDKKLLGQSESLVDGAIQKMDFYARNTQNAYAYFRNSKNIAGGNYPIFAKPSDLRTQLGNSFDYILYNPENPNQIIFKSSRVNMARQDINLSEAAAPLIKINYAVKYANNESIDMALTLAKQMDSDLLRAGFDGDEGKFKAVSNSAKALFMRDTRANYIAAQYPTLNDEAMKLTMLTLNALCAENQNLKDKAQKYIDTKGMEGSVECVGDDWKVMGTGTQASYIASYNEARKALVDKWYNDFVSLNTAYVESLQSNESNDIYKQTSQCGGLCLIDNGRTILNEIQFNADSASDFADGSFIDQFEVKAQGDYIDDSFYKNITGFEVGSQLNLETFIRTHLFSSSKSLPALNTDYVLQSAMTKNGVTATQDNDLSKGAALAFQAPDIELKAALMSTQDVVRSMSIYGTKMANAQGNIMEVVLSVKGIAVLGEMITADRNKAASGNAANVGKAKMKTSSKHARNGFNAIFTALDSMSDMAIKAVMFTVPWSVSLNYLVSVSGTYVFKFLYLNMNFYTQLLEILCSLMAVTMWRMNDDDNIKRITNNLFAMLMVPVVMPSVILIGYIVFIVVSNIMTRAAMLLIYNVVPSSPGASMGLIYIMGMLMMFCVFFSTQISSLVLSIQMQTTTLRTMGFGKHLFFFEDAMRQVQKITSIFALLTFFTGNITKNAAKSIIGFMSLGKK